MSYKISVILPVYKSEKYILACLKSIVYQTYPPYEIIVVSDGCLDDSVSIAREFLSKTSIKYKIFDYVNQGVSSARNYGIERATGDWIIAMDSDDCVFPQTFELLMSHAAGQDVLAVGYGLNQSPENNPIVEDSDILFLSGKEALAKFYNRQFRFVSPAMMLNRKFIFDNALKYDVGCLFAEDDIYVWKVLCRITKMVYINKPLYNYIFHPGSTMTTPSIDKFYSVKRFSEELDMLYVQESSNVGVYKDKILYRHYWGLIHAAAKVQKYKEFKSLVGYYDMKALYGKRRKLFSSKDKLMFDLPLLCPLIAYVLFRLK